MAERIDCDKTLPKGFDGVPDDPEESSREGRRRDPELLQVERIARMLEELDEAARRRIVVYLTDRYAQSIPF